MAKSRHQILFMLVNTNPFVPLLQMTKDNFLKIAKKNPNEYQLVGHIKQYQINQHNFNIKNTS